MADKSFILRMEIENGQAVVRQIEDLGAAGERAGRKIKQAVDAEATPAMRAYTHAVDQSGAALTRAGQALLAYVSIRGLQQLAAQAVEAAKRFDDLGDTSERLGTSAGELVKWQGALVRAGGSLEGFTSAADAFQGKIGAFVGGIGKTKAIGEALEQIGISREQIGALATMEERLLLIAEGIEKVEDRAVRAAIADKLGIRELLPLLEQGADGIKRMTAEFDGLGKAADEGVARAGALGDQIELLNREMQLKSDNLFVRITPFVIEFYQWLSAVIDLIGENRDLFEVFFGSGVTSGFFAPLNMAENALTPTRELLVLQRELHEAYSELTIAEESNGKISVGDIQATINELEARVASLKSEIGLSGGAGNLAGRGVKPRAAALTPPEIDDGPAAVKAGGSSAWLRKAEADAARSLAEEERNRQAEIKARVDSSIKSLELMAEATRGIDFAAEGVNARFRAMDQIIGGNVRSLEDLLNVLVDIVAQFAQMAAQQAAMGQGDFFGNLGGLIAGALGFGSAITGPVQGGANALLGAGLGSLGLGGRRAMGGPVDPFKTYLVGEHGPERVTFGAPGYVHNATHTAAMMAAQQRQAAMAVNVAAPQVEFKVINQGPPMEVETRQSRGADGRLQAEAILRPIVSDIQKSNIASGRTDSALKGRFGQRPLLTRR